jgi:hypothetical protein
MKTRSLLNGKNTLRSDVTNIGSLGFWLLADDHEYFVPFADYPVFQSATIIHIFNVQRIDTGQYHWPDLDADIELDALEHPEHYPLVWRDKRRRS